MRKTLAVSLLTAALPLALLAQPTNRQTVTLVADVSGANGALPAGGALSGRVTIDMDFYFQADLEDDSAEGASDAFDRFLGFVDDGGSTIDASDITAVTVRTMADLDLALGSVVSLTGAEIRMPGDSTTPTLDLSISPRVLQSAASGITGMTQLSTDMEIQMAVAIARSPGSYSLALMSEAVPAGEAVGKLHYGAETNDRLTRRQLSQIITMLMSIQADIDEIQGDEPPTEEPPTEEPPTEEPPTDETPTDETPTDETPTDQTPSEGSSTPPGV